MRSRTRTSLRLLFVALLTVVTGQIFIRDAQAYRLDPPEISVYARNESDARSHVDMMCNSGYPVGHGGYVHDIWLDEETGKLTWSVTTISRRCDSTDATATTLYAVTGYDGICPTAGWYHNGSQDTHDCIKYQDPATMTGVSKCGGPYPINDCVKYGNWWSIVKGSGTQPSTNYTYRTYRDGFEAQIPNWKTAKHADGEYTFINNQTLCGWWTLGGVRYESQSCQTIWAKIKWHAEWYLSGESYIGKDGRVSGSNSDARNRIQGTIKGIRPGATLYWDHWVRNDGPDGIPTTSNVQANINSERSAIGGSGQGSQQVVDSYLTNWKYVAPGTTFVNDHNEYLRKWRTVVNQDDVGQKVCQRVSWYWNSWNDARWAYSSPSACAEVPYHYPSCDDPNDPDCKDPYPYPSDPDGDCTFEGGCDDGDKPTQAVNTNTNSDKDEVMTGEDVTFTYNIWNDRGPTKTKNIEYHVYAFLLKGGADLPDNSEDSVIYPLGANTGCYGRDVDGNGYVDGRCQQVASGGTGELSPGNSVKPKPTQKFTILENWLGQPGDQICSYVVLGATWNVYDGVNSGTQLASNIKCVKIGKRPQIQINGSDSYANKGFTGSKYSDIELNYQRGSYSQYGILTGSGGSSNFGSAGYTFSKSSNASKACQLGWANTSCNNSFSAGGLTHTFYNAVTVTDATSYPGSLSSLSSPSGGGTSYYQASGGTNFSGNLNPGTRAVVYVNGDANITGNIIAYGAAGVSGSLPTNPDTGGSTNNLNQTFTNLVDIPSLTIVATGDININGSVTTIDANLVSKNGRVITCAGSDGGGTKTELGIGSTQCANKLKINGAVASKESPILHRIFGAGNTIDTTSNTNQWNNLMNSSSSEWFNYTPNVWLTPYLNGGGDTPNNYTTVQVTNLPARY